MQLRNWRVNVRVFDEERSYGPYFTREEAERVEAGLCCCWGEVTITEHETTLLSDFLDS
jgi:hypothetical protein